MVAVMELSEGDRAALERAKEGASPGAIAVAVEILAKQALGATRLSPPAPEVDENDIWNWHAKSASVRTALSELIASKDAEIEQIVKRESETVDQLGHAIRRYNQSQHELAALRAENERLKATLNTLGTRWALRKAAERNTAEPAKTHVWPATHDDACSEIKDTETQPGTNAGAVEVTHERTHADDMHIHEILGYLDSYKLGSWAPLYHAAAQYRTEAEARGRREALEIMEKHAAIYDGADGPSNRAVVAAFGHVIDELKRIMTEVK